MKQKNNVLRLAIAACFGMVAGQAGAAGVLGTSVGEVWALENANNATLLNVGAAKGTIAMDIPAIPGLLPKVATPMYLKVALLNGAVFGSAPQLFCAGKGNVDGLLPATVTGTIDIGGAIGDSTVTFRVTTALGGDAAGATAVVLTGACTVSATSITVSGLTTKTMSAQIEYTNGAVVATTATVGNYITFQRGLAATVTAPGVGVVVDATSGSDNWAVGSNLTVGTAYIGAVTFGGQAVANGTTAVDAAGAQILAAGGLASAMLTVSGPAIAASIARGVTGMYLSTVSGCANTTVTASFTTSASSTSVTFNNLTPAVLTAGVFICATVPGNVSITTGQLTATLTGYPVATTQTLNTTATSNNIANVTANGSTRNAYFVNASTSTNKTSILRIINKGGVAGALTASAYDEAGTLLGTANSSLGTLAVNQMMSKTSAELETALGFTPASATAKYSVVISGAVPSFEVLNFTKDNATGNLTLSNTSTTNTQ